MGIFDLFKPKRDPPKRKRTTTTLDYKQTESISTKLPKTKAK